MLLNRSAPKNLLRTKERVRVALITDDDLSLIPTFLEDHQDLMQDIVMTTSDCSHGRYGAQNEAIYIDTVSKRN